MAKPSLTYDHGYLTDCEDKTSWTEDGSPTLTDTGLTVLYNDIFRLTGTASAADKKTYWEYDITNITSASYPYFMVYYETSVGSVGLGAKVELVFTSGTQTILDTDFSTTWKIASGTVTEGKTVDKVRFYAVSDAACSGQSVSYDFLLLHAGIFNFPFVSGREQLDLVNTYADLMPPGRQGFISQYVGMESPLIQLSGEMDTGSGWGTPDGEYLYKIWKLACSDPWQWFDSDLIKCKVTPRRFTLSKDSSVKAQRDWSCELRKYDRSSGAESVWGTLQYYGEIY